VGYHFAGALSSGLARGVCLGCAAMLRRFVPGIGAIMNGIRPVLAGSPFLLQGMAQPTMDWAPVGLVAVLGELGATRLPDPRSRGLLQPHEPAPRRR
jgi:hypothetical protein